MTSMTSTERYRKDDAYRQRTIRRTKERHAANLESANYRELVRARKTRWQIHESIAADRRRIKLKQQRLKALGIRIERLELAWGSERAQRKKHRNG